jgi:hypothetical protein
MIITPRKMNIFRYLGINEDSNIPRPVEELVDKAIDVALPLLVPKWSYKKLEYYKGKETLGINSSYFFIEENKAKDIYLFAATIGNDLEMNVKNLFQQGEYALGTALDSVGTVCIENLIDKIEEDLKDHYKGNGPFTKRKSPGYGNWDLKWQKPLLGCLEANFIELQPSFLMLPQKTVTAAFLSFEGDMVKEFNGCSQCNLSSCTFNSKKVKGTFPLP